VAEPLKAVFDETGMSTVETNFEDLMTALQRLDRRIEQAMAAAQAAYGPEAASDPYRGLYINQGEVERLMARAPVAPAWQMYDRDESLPDPCCKDSRLAWLEHTFDLSLFDLDVMLVALAPELDLRYERLYSYLQDDVTRRRPSVDLALNLLCSSAEAKLERRTHFAADAPLIRHNLLYLIADTNHSQTPLLSHTLKLDEQIIRLLLNQENLDRRLASFCKVVAPVAHAEHLSLNRGAGQSLPLNIERLKELPQPLRFYFYGPSVSDKRRAAEALACELGVPLLIVDMARASASEMDFEHLLKLVFREAEFRQAVLYLDDLESLRADGQALHYRLLLSSMAEYAGIAIVAGHQAWLTGQPSNGSSPEGIINVHFSIPDFERRREFWKESLAAASITLDEQALNSLASRFRLTSDQIFDSVATARNQVLWRAATQESSLTLSPASNQPGVDDLLAAARTQSGHDLETLTRKIVPVYCWDDIVLPDEAMTQLREICQRVAERYRVLGEWGFGRKLSIGKGVNALFAGPSGTGKTMAAEIIASELGLDLYKIDLSGVVSKYIGETEKNLDRIFAAAENANAIAFFDECDALFGKRSEVRDSHDRYANIEISYLLQKMEEYEGVAILATNLRQNLDESFIRRLAFIIHFPFPDKADRQRIWSKIWPAETPLAADLDLGFLAHRFKLSGGNIKNIVLAAAFIAANDGGRVTTAHLLQATRREYQKMGKPLNAVELELFVPEVSA
jgi:SpoVK/Ycf46/Vps4 family AAA+-type ATPase